MLKERCLSKHKRMPTHVLVRTLCMLLDNLLMILPQVHLRKPCYDFYFL
jgi:hypothetical protein